MGNAVADFLFFLGRTIDEYSVGGLRVDVVFLGSCRLEVSKSAKILRAEV